MRRGPRVYDGTETEPFIRREARGEGAGVAVGVDALHVGVTKRDALPPTETHIPLSAHCWLDVSAADAGRLTSSNLPSPSREQS